MEKCSGESSGRKSTLVHGTMNAYTHHKCRCELCNQANRDRMNKYNASKRI